MQNTTAERATGRKIMLETLDLLSGAVFPFVIMCVISSTIIMFAGSEDVVAAALALVAGEAFIIIAMVMFGRANGGAAYRKSYLNATKRALDNREEKVVLRIGEYSLWKGFAIPLIDCVPFVIFQIIDIAVPGTKFCAFMLEYVFAWAYYPFHLAGLHGAFNLLLVFVPVVTHAAGYVLGMRKEERVRAELEAQNEASAARRRKGREGKK